MILYMPTIYFSDEEWLCILKEYLNGWTEIPLNMTSGYDLDTLKFYDGFIGLLLKQTEKCLKECPNILDKSFINSWKYQGKLYRIIHAAIVQDESAEEGVSYELPKVEYHGMISHWTNDYTFKGLRHKLSAEVPYIILEADTQDHLGFDVNKFRRKYDREKHHTEIEQEIIFPMYKDCIIKEYRMSINEFVKFKQESLKGYK